MLASLTKYAVTTTGIINAHQSASYVVSCALLYLRHIKYQYKLLSSAFPPSTWSCLLTIAQNSEHMHNGVKCADEQKCIQCNMCLTTPLLLLLIKSTVRTVLIKQSYQRCRLLPLLQLLLLLLLANSAGV